MIFAIFVCMFVGLLFFGLFLLEYRKYVEGRQQLKAHLGEIAAGSPFLKVEKKQNVKTRLLNRMFHYADDFSGIGHRINFFSESQDVEKWLVQAGHPYELNVERFQGLKIFALILGALAGAFFFVLRFPFSQFALILLPLAGYFITIFWLKGLAKKRQDELAYSLPDFLDTMSVTLEAGIALDQAMREIVRYFEGPLREEFTRFLQETDLGIPRTVAYENLLKRNDNMAFTTVIRALMQGERLGVPISTTFKMQAEDMRKIRKEKIKEVAAKASPKITMITTFIVMPSAMLLIGGLMILNMFTGDNNVFDLFK